MGSEKGSFQRTSCSRNFRKEPFFFSWEAREAAAVMTELIFEDMERVAVPHHASPLPCWTLSAEHCRTMPGQLEGSQLVPSLPPYIAFPCPSPCPATWDAVAWGTGFHIQPAASEEKAALLTRLWQTMEAHEPLSLPLNQPLLMPVNQNHRFIGHPRLEGNSNDHLVQHFVGKGDYRW